MRSTSAAVNLGMYRPELADRCIGSAWSRQAECNKPSDDFIVESAREPRPRDPETGVTGANEVTAHGVCGNPLETRVASVFARIVDCASISYGKYGNCGTVLYPNNPALAVFPMNLIQRRLNPSMGATLLDAPCNHFTGQVID